MNSDATQPTRPQKSDQGSGDQTRQNRVSNRQPEGSPPVKPPAKPRRGWLSLLMAVVLFIGGLMILSAISGWLGYQSGQQQRYAQITVTVDAYLAGQLAQAIEDVTNENYILAQERLEYILSVKPNYKPAMDLLVDIGVMLNVTATPTQLPPTATPKPTKDARPAREIYSDAMALISLEEWDTALDTLANLRGTYPGYRIVEVDDLIYLCLRNRGVEKILNKDLEGGTYDFLLAEQFGPLDGETENYRNWARLYLLGNAFWGAYPEQAAYYYGQLVSAAPSITDASGVSAFYRYWASLLQIAENAAKEGKWCESSEGMVHVLGSWDQAYVYPTATYVYEQCLLGTPSVTPTPTITSTPTATLEVTGEAPSITPTPGGATNTPTSTPAPVENTPTNTPTANPSPTSNSPQ
jgi:cell division septation protein DedD